jgi:TRAP-type uncharacterized transport system substrate-binding protein
MLTESLGWSQSPTKSPVQRMLASTSITKDGIVDVPFYNVHLQLGSPRYVVLVNTAKFVTLEKSERKFVDEAGNAISANYTGHFCRGHLRSTVMRRI